MPLTAELAALNLDPAQQEGVVAAVLPLRAEAEKLRAQAKLDALKIQALTLELAHLRRIRFGVKTKPCRRSSGICSARRLTPTAPPSRPKSSSSCPSCAPSPSAPVASPCRSICRASNTATNPNAPMASAAASGS